MMHEYLLILGSCKDSSTCSQTSLHFSEPSMSVINSTIHTKHIRDEFTNWSKHFSMQNCLNTYEPSAIHIPCSGILKLHFSFFCLILSSKLVSLDRTRLLVLNIVNQIHHVYCLYTSIHKSPSNFVV